MTKAIAVLFYPSLSEDSYKCLRAPVKTKGNGLLVASYITVKSTQIVCSVARLGVLGLIDSVNAHNIHDWLFIFFTLNY